MTNSPLAEAMAGDKYWGDQEYAPRPSVPLHLGIVDNFGDKRNSDTTWNITSTYDALVADGYLAEPVPDGEVLPQIERGSRAILEVVMDLRQMRGARSSFMLSSGAAPEDFDLRAAEMVYTRLYSGASAIAHVPRDGHVAIVGRTTGYYQDSMTGSQYTGRDSNSLSRFARIGQYNHFERRLVVGQTYLLRAGYIGRVASAHVLEPGTEKAIVPEAATAPVELSSMLGFRPA